MTSPVTLKPQYFEAMYQAASDPWGFESRWYERRKYAISMALLPAERYRAAFEPGCSIGVFSALLAPRCDRLLCCDGAAAAVRAARARTEQLPCVRVEQRTLPEDWPRGRFDLIVFSELLYYFGDSDLSEVIHRGSTSLRPGGTLLAVHWRHPVADYPRSGDSAHAAIAAHGALARLARHDERDFLAEIYVRTDGAAPLSVAQATGLA
jgi:SAM-dependent methyltransferase